MAGGSLDKVTQGRDWRSSFLELSTTNEWRMRPQSNAVLQTKSVEILQSKEHRDNMGPLESWLEKNEAAATVIAAIATGWIWRTSRVKPWQVVKVSRAEGQLGSEELLAEWTEKHLLSKITIYKPIVENTYSTLDNSIRIHSLRYEKMFGETWWLYGSRGCWWGRMEEVCCYVTLT